MNITDLPYQFLTGEVASHDHIVVGPGKDDCSVLSLNGKLLVTTTDFINSRPASLTLNVGDLDDLGYLAVIANVSDLIGTGAKPIGCLFGVQLGADHSKEEYEKIMTGACRCLDEYRIPLLGGDTKKGGALSIYGVGIGTADSKQELFLTDRAIPGEPVLLSGPIGAFNAAVFALSTGRCPAKLKDACIEAIVRPSLPYALSQQIAQTRMSRAGIDISDGLGADLARLAMVSRVGLHIWSTEIPLSPLAIAVGDEFSVNPIKFAFATGGDFQFAVTGPVVDGAQQIGMVTEEELGLVLEHGGVCYSLPTRGHDDALMPTFQEEVNALLGELQL